MARGPNKSPWEIGAEHWDQRDLYTRNARTDDSGYGRGPDEHPDVGSYAYVRPPERAPRHHPERTLELQRVFAQEAWPWRDFSGPPSSRGPSAPPSSRRPELAPSSRPTRPSPARNLRERPPTQRLWVRIRREARHVQEEIAEVMIGRPLDAQRAEERMRLTDMRLAENVHNALITDEEIDARDIDTYARDGVIILEGTVRDRHSRRVAEDIADGVPGVVDVVNRLHIRRDDDTGILIGPLRTV